MNLAEYWDRLENSINQFQPFATNVVGDQENFDLQKRTLLQMVAKGRNIVALGASTAAINLGIELANLPIQTYGSSGLPPVIGPLSLAFAEQVYLPHLERFKQVDFNFFERSFAKLLPSEIQPDVSKKTAAKNANELRERINLHKGIKKPQPKTEREILKLELSSTQELLNIINHIIYSGDQAYKTKKSLKEILDSNNEHATFEKYIAASNYPQSIKDYLLWQEKENNTVTNNVLSFLTQKRLGHYKPRDILAQSNNFVLQERYRIEGKLKLNQSLLSCLNKLLDNRKSDFYQSAKCVDIAAIKYQADNHPSKSEELIPRLKAIVTPKRDEGKWYAWFTRKNKPATSLTIFSNYFSDDNKAIPSSVRDLSHAKHQAKSPKKR